MCATCAGSVTGITVAVAGEERVRAFLVGRTWSELAILEWSAAIRTIGGHTESRFTTTHFPRRAVRVDAADFDRANRVTHSGITVAKLARLAPHAWAAVGRVVDRHDWVAARGRSGKASTHHDGVTRTVVASAVAPTRGVARRIKTTLVE